MKPGTIQTLAMLSLMGCAIQRRASDWRNVADKVEQELLAQDRAEIRTLTIQRDFYRDQMAKATDQIGKERVKAYDKGIKAGAAGVKCIAKWEPAK